MIKELKGNDKSKQAELTRELVEASVAYYETGASPMSDIEFDKKAAKLKKMEDESGYTYDNSPSIKVGAKPKSSEIKKARHEYPALSLDKIKYADRENLKGWLGDKEGVISWKLDGLTVVLTYDDGKLTSAVTRGDGYEGTVVTENARNFKGVPEEIAYEGHLVIRGEAVMPFAEFERLNAETGGIYENPRNLAAATVQMLDTEEAKKREIDFLAFELVAPEPETKILSVEFDTGENEPLISSFNISLFKERIGFLSALGFWTVPIGFGVTSEYILEVIDRWEEDLQLGLMYPTDGLVITYDDCLYGLSLGSTEHHPRHSIAMKWTDETYETTIRNIEWSIGKTGIITPVAVFDEVRMGVGSNVSRASLHNLSIMKRLSDKTGGNNRSTMIIGSKAEVYMANMIIPQVASITKTEETEAAQTPYRCPACGELTSVVWNPDTNVEVLMCTNHDGCPAQQTGKLMNTFSKNGLFIKGLGESQIQDLINAGIVTSDPVSFYELANSWKAFQKNPLKNTSEPGYLAIQNLLKKSGWGQKRWDNLINAIDASRETTLQKFLYSLNIPLLGNDLSKKLSNFWHEDVNMFVDFIESIPLPGGASKNILCSIDGVGDEKAQEIISWADKMTRKEGWNQVKALIEELKFPKSEFREILECVNMDTFEPVDTEGHTMEGAVTYKGKEYFVHVSFYSPESTWEEAVANDILRQIKEASDAANLTGKTFVITGNVHDYKNRDEFKASVEARGGKVAGSVSAKTTALVNNDVNSTSGKNKKAKELGIEIISEDEFISRYGK